MGSYITQPGVEYSVPVTTGVIYASPITPATTVFVSTPQAYIPYVDSPTSPMSMAGSTHHTHFAPPVSPVIQTEARKVIITQLPHSSSLTDLRDLLNNTITKSSRSYSGQALQELEIATHPDGTARGHAFATLESHHLAKSVIRTLDGSKFKGRTIQARFAKEGVEASRAFESQGDSYFVSAPAAKLSSSSGSHRKSRSGKDREKDVERREKSGESGKSSKKSKEGESSRKEREKERERGKVEVRETPLVVDGSSKCHREK
jgi:hypothetical protein